MKLKFVGGPWDGIEFEAGYAPDHIQFSTLVEDKDAPEEERSDPEFGSQVTAMLDDSVALQGRGQIAYERDDTGKDGAGIRYRYSPGSKPWWESWNVPSDSKA